MRLKAPYVNKSVFIPHRGGFRYTAGPDGIMEAPDDQENEAFLRSLGWTDPDPESVPEPAPVTPIHQTRVGSALSRSIASPATKDTSPGPDDAEDTEH